MLAAGITLVIAALISSSVTSPSTMDRLAYSIAPTQYPPPELFQPETSAIPLPIGRNAVIKHWNGSRRLPHPPAIPYPSPLTVADADTVAPGIHGTGRLEYDRSPPDKVLQNRRYSRTGAPFSKQLTLNSQSEASSS